MPKHKNRFFFQMSREPFKNNDLPAKINSLSLSAFKLFVWLNEIEHRFTTGEEQRRKGDKRKADWFFHSNAALVKDTGMSERAITNAKNELKELGFIHTWQMHWEDGNGKLSYKHVTAFRLLV